MPYLIRLFITLFMILNSTISSAEVASDEVQITKVWARPAFEGRNSAIYFNIENSNKAEDIKIISANGGAAKVIELHQSYMEDGGIMKMVHLDQILIPAGATVEFKPKSLHVMLIGLKKDLKIGEYFPIKLQFSNFTKEVMVEVRKSASKACSCQIKKDDK